MQTASRVQVEHSRAFPHAMLPQQWIAHCVGVAVHVAGKFWQAALPLHVPLQTPGPHAIPPLRHAFVPMHLTSHCRLSRQSTP